VMQSVNRVYKDIAEARVREGRLLKQSRDPELGSHGADVDSYRKLLVDIDEIGSVLKENRKRVSTLQLRMKKYNYHIASLDTLVSNLNQEVLQREESILRLQAKVQGLEASLADKTKLLEDRKTTIERQMQEMHTGFYVVGTREELKKKGIIEDEGGFLWGLLGSTTIMAGEVDPAEFTPIDKSKDKTIHVKGKIEEILPRRSESLFTLAREQDKSSDLTIASPDKFWQNNYLIIVVD
jgi:hypothetical protein